ncbi:MAG TPA: hypothetical protein VGM44_15040 [Polyangiaceae bacterium]|jgi:predicted esterase
MAHARARRFGAKGLVCFLVGFAWFVLSRRAGAAEPRVIELAETADLPGVVIFPARASEARPITVLLHGMCGEPIRTCSHFAAEVTENANLVCPRASQRCTGGGVSWPQTGFASAVARAVERAKSALPIAADETRGRTLIGYSLGAYRALELAQSTPNPYRRVMLIGARVSLNRQLLAENGVERVLLSAGSWDMMHDAMQREAARAVRVGIHARFLDLGPVGHAFTPSFANYLPIALEWLDES